MKKYVTAIALLALIALPIFAAEIDGTWTRPVGKRDSILEKLTLKASGNALSGTFEPGGGKLPPVQITEGKISGEEVSFKVIRETPDKGRVTQVYVGKVETGWDTLRLSVTSQGTFNNPGIELPAQEQVFKKK